MPNSADLPVVTLGPYDGAEVGEYSIQFPGSPLSAQRFAKRVIERGGSVRIGRRGTLYIVFHRGIGWLDK
jgi:hypothetical protein